MRFVNIKQSCAGWLRRLASYRLRRDGDPLPAVEVDRAGSRCFGSVAERDQLALEGLIAGQDPSAGGPTSERPGRHRTDPAGKPYDEAR